MPIKLMSRTGGQIEPARLAGLLEYFKSQHISASLALKILGGTNNKKPVVLGANKTIIMNGISGIRNCRNCPVGR